MPDIGLLHRSFFSTQKALLDLSQCSARLDHIDSFDAGRKGLEVSKRLFQDKISQHPPV